MNLIEVMKENKYDDDRFFSQYAQMSRSVEGLQGAGEWHILQKMLPDFTDKRVLDLGCGFGWHCIYAIEHGAKCVTGIDISGKMLEEAQKRNSSPLSFRFPGADSDALEHISFTAKPGETTAIIGSKHILR
mgnify:CR=1 FL=1